MERQESSTLEGIRADHVHRYRFAAARVKGRVLDAACGCGYGSWMMHSERASVTGIDLEPAALKYAERFYKGPEYALADVREHEGAYDWVVSFETLEHMPDPERALAKFRASPNLICSTPNQEQFKFRADAYKDDKFPHIRHYTPKEFDALLEASGWKVVSRHCQHRHIASHVREGTDGMYLVYVCS